VHQTTDVEGNGSYTLDYASRELANDRAASQISRCDGGLSSAQASLEPCQTSLLPSRVVPRTPGQSLQPLRTTRAGRGAAGQTVLTIGG